MGPLRVTTVTSLRQAYRPECPSTTGGLAPYRGQPLPVVLKGKRTTKGSNETSRSAQDKSWIPDEYRLPDTVEAIEAGRPERPRQQSLFDQDGREARIERLTRRARG
jgi:hypothetical protein